MVIAYVTTRHSESWFVFRAPSQYHRQWVQEVAADPQSEITIKRESSSGMWITILTSNCSICYRHVLLLLNDEPDGGRGARGAMNFGRNQKPALLIKILKVRFQM